MKIPGNIRMRWRVELKNRIIEQNLEMTKPRKCIRLRGITYPKILPKVNTRAISQTQGNKISKRSITLRDKFPMASMDSIKPSTAELASHTFEWKPSLLWITWCYEEVDSRGKTPKPFSCQSNVFQKLNFQDPILLFCVYSKSLKQGDL